MKKTVSVGLGKRVQELEDQLAEHRKEQEQRRERDESYRFLTENTSGYSLDGEATDILKRGCDGFIQKPLKFKDLSLRIRAIMECP